ncbi:MAG: 3-deoxy-D-manno-octulosonic acid transferase [Bacteroidota bacterium]
MRFLYYAGIYGYYFLILVASLWNEKARHWVIGRKNWLEKLKQNVREKEGWIWFHCASLGEFEQGRPLIEKIKNDYPVKNILVTFFSPSGYEIGKKYECADYICYIPLDTRKNAKNFIDVVQPEKVFFVKYEFWFHFLNTLQKNNIRVYLISGIFRKSQIFFKPWGTWFQKMLHAFNHFFVQNEASLILLKKLGFENVTITGDTRFDRVNAIVQAPEKYAAIEKFKGGNVLIIAGSSWEPEEKLLMQYISDCPQGVRLLLAPHQIHEQKMEALSKKLGDRAIRFTQIKPDKQLTDKKVLIMDTMGMLTSVYQYGDIAVVGGAFGKGLHNILEPAAYGMPVIFGPKYQKFQEAIDLLNRGGAVRITNAQELNEALDRLIEDETERNNKGTINRQYIEESLGASETILRHVFIADKNF